MKTKALLVGINAYTAGPLRGCVNDVLGMKAILTERYKVPADDITVVTDRDATMDRIKSELRRLAEGTGDGDTVRLFHYSGHGSYEADLSGDEPDGRDEGLCPWDYDTAGLLLDDTLAELYRGFGPRCHLALVMDSCHSGSVQRAIEDDVVYRFLPPRPEVDAAARERALAYESQRDAWVRTFVREHLGDGRDAVPVDRVETLVDEALRAFERKRYGFEAVEGPVVLVAGCRDNQTSADAHFKEGYYGALSYHLQQALRNGSGTSYKDLVGAASRAMGAGGFSQVPQLQCSRATMGLPFLNA